MGVADHSAARANKDILTYANLIAKLTAVDGAETEEYTISLEADWQLPLLFSGKMTGISVQTAPIYMDGEKLNTPGSGTYLIQSTLQNDLPFDCTVTPVFTLEDNEPVFLDAFTSKANYYGYTFKHTFTSTKDHWKASLYFIITPAKFVSVQFDRSQNMVLKDALFTANLRDKE